MCQRSIWFFFIDSAMDRSLKDFDGREQGVVGKRLAEPLDLAEEEMPCRKKQKRSWPIPSDTDTDDDTTRLGTASRYKEQKKAVFASQVLKLQ
jgi:hypothetical protein